MQDAGSRAVTEIDAGCEPVDHWLCRAADLLDEGWARIDGAGRLDAVAGPLFAILDSPRPHCARIREATRTLWSDLALSWPPDEPEGWRWAASRQDGRRVSLEAHALERGWWLLRARWLEAACPTEPAPCAGLYHPVTRLPQPPLLLDRLQQAIERSQRTVTHRFALILVGLPPPAGSTMSALKAIGQALEEAVRPADTVGHVDDATLAVLVEPVRGDDRTAQIAIEAVVENLQAAIDQVASAAAPAGAATFSIALGDGGSHASDLIALARSRLAGRAQAPATFATLAPEASLATRQRTALVAEAGSLPDQKSLLDAVATRFGECDPGGLVLAVGTVPPIEALQELASALARLEHRLSVVVELDEAAVTRDPETAIQFADAAAARGIGIGLSGFGRSRCPEVLVERLRPSRLTLDAELAADARHAIPSRVRLAAAIAGAHERGLPVTAPGVEDAAHAALLASLGCDSVRGPLVAEYPAVGGTPG